MSFRSRLLLTAVGAFVLILGFYFLLVQPRRSELQKVNEEAEAEQSQTVSLEAELSRLRGLEEQAPVLNRRLERLRELVPGDHELADFLLQIEGAADEAGVDFFQITPELPKPPPEGAQVAEVRATIQARGRFFSIEDFTQRLYDLARAVRIDSLTLSKEEGEELAGRTEVTLNATLRIFFELPPGAEVNPPENPAAPTAPAPSEGTQTS